MEEAISSNDSMIKIFVVMQMLKKGCLKVILVNTVKERERERDNVTQRVSERWTERVGG